MSSVSYEILTVVKRAFHGKDIRAYVFTGQIIVTNMSKRDFIQLGVPFNKAKRAVFPVKDYLPTRTEKTAIALKQAITKRMNRTKDRYEKKLQVRSERLPITLTAAGNYKDTLSL